MAKKGTFVIDKPPDVLEKERKERERKKKEEERKKVEDELRKLNAWMPEELLKVYTKAWIKYGPGKEALALAEMRQHKSYDKHFLGNRNEDGSLKYDELQYLAIRNDYRDTLLYDAGLNPDKFMKQIGEAIGRNKSPGEFKAQVQQLVTRVGRHRGFTDAYAKFFGGGKPYTTTGVIASLLSKEIANDILEERITMAEIAGEGSRASGGYAIGRDLAERLYGAGIDRTRAQSLFAQADQWLPVLTALQRRHADPDDPFDITSFTEAQVLGDADDMQQFRRLVAQERASFSEAGNIAITTSQRTGGLTGLGAL